MDGQNWRVGAGEGGGGGGGCDVYSYTKPPAAILRASHFLTSPPGFLNGLHKASVFVPIISEDTLAGIKKNAATGTDNVLLEYEAALELHAASRMAIIPLLVGKHKSVEGEGAVYKRFAVPRMDEFPDAPHAGSGKNVRATMEALFALQVIPPPPRYLWLDVSINLTKTRSI